jgi:hypothetical protein
MVQRPLPPTRTLLLVAAFAVATMGCDRLAWKIRRQDWARVIDDSAPLKACLLDHGVEPATFLSCLRSSPDKDTCRQTCVPPGKDTDFKTCVLNEEARVVVASMPDIMDLAREELLARAAAGEKLVDVDPKILVQEHPKDFHQRLDATNWAVSILQELRDAPAL